MKTLVITIFIMLMASVACADMTVYYDIGDLALASDYYNDSEIGAWWAVYADYGGLSVTYGIDEVSVIYLNGWEF